MSYQKQIADVLGTVLTGPMGLDAEQCNDLERFVEVPKSRENGDFAFPCFRLAKALRKNPAKIAADLLPHLEAGIDGVVDLASVTATGPYLNFRVNKTALAARLIPAILGGTFLERQPEKNVRVMIEYSQPNTHKAFHVGHTRNVALGDALVRMFEWSGYDVVAANYIGDEGAHIAKCLWYYENHFEGEIPDGNLGEFLGDLYTRATVLLDFSTLSRCPLLNVATARVEETRPHPSHEGWLVVTVNTGSEQQTVVCGGKGFKTGDMVAYAREGSRVGGRQIGVLDKEGVTSTGMICSGKELGLSDDQQTIYVFPADTETGIEVAEYFRIDGALDPEVSVPDEMKRRREGVGHTLKRLESKEPEIDALWQKTRKWSLDEFDHIYRYLNSRFDHFFYESEVGNKGKVICQEYYEKGVLVASEGAIGADLSDVGLPFFLLIKSDGAGLYSTKDIALAHEKFNGFGIDRSIYVVDYAQTLHFQQVFKTLEKMGYENAKRCYHLSYGRVVLQGGEAMSSRVGNVILFSQLKARLEEKIRTEFLDNFKGEWPDEEIDEAARCIAVATIKYGMTNQDNQKNIEFDLDEWTSKSGNTGPYLMYAYARTRSILRKAGDWDASLADWALLGEDAEQQLLSHMARFHEVVESACENYRPQWLCIYLYQLAKNISRFYDECPVLKAGSPALMATRLQLVDAAGQLLSRGLSLLGIQTIERM